MREWLDPTRRAAARVVQTGARVRIDRNKVARRARAVGRWLAYGAVALNVASFLAAWVLTHFTPRSARFRMLSAIGTVSLPRPENARRPDFGLPWEAHTFEGAHDASLEAWHVPAQPSRGLVVLFHGYADSKARLFPAAREFLRLGWSVLLVDFNGSGGSEGSATSVGFHEAVDVAAALSYARGLEPRRPVVLYGASMGAAAILGAAARHSIEPEALILECPFDNLLATVSHRFEQRHLAAAPLAHLVLFWGGVQHGFNPFRHNPAAYAKSVTVPALLMAADGDPYVTLNETRAIFASLAGPKLLRTCSASRHVVCLSADAEQWRRAVGELLQLAEPAVPATSDRRLLAAG
jgi:alpha-beta hydrolase superfamily lysophospholipase